jgi:hypothetical protein
MRILVLTIAFLLGVTAQASALTACPLSEFTLDSLSGASDLDVPALETIAAAANRSRVCDQARFVVRADGQSRHGPNDAYAIYRAIEAQGIEPSTIRVDLLTPASDRWSEQIARGAIVVNIYFSHDTLPEPVASPMRCFDVALVAQITRYDPDPMDWPDDVIVMRWTWTVSLDVEQVLIGEKPRQQLNVSMSLHGEMRSDVKHVLFFLQRTSTGYAVVDHDTRVVTNRRGAFILPMSAPLNADQIYPLSWAPPDYEAHLRPARYRAQDAWWLRRAEAEATSGWSVQRGNRVVAARGLELSDLPNLIAESPRLRCHG